MKKSFRNYAIGWALLFAAFQAVVFGLRPILPGYEIHYDARFWIGWSCIFVAFAGNLGCAYAAFREKNLQKLFYQIPLISVSGTGLVLTLIFGLLIMLIPNCPAWIAAVGCVLLLAVNAAAVLKAGWAADAVSEIDEKVAAQTGFLKAMTAEAEVLMHRAKSSEVREECKRVYEALRYSDPRSTDALSEIEEKISSKIKTLSEKIDADDIESVRVIANELVTLAGERNVRCKSGK